MGKLIVVTAHADMRIKQRMPGMKSAKRRATLAEAAYNNGVRLENATKSQSVRILKHFKEEYPGRDVVLYADRIFIFQDVWLVTMLPNERQQKKRGKYNRAREQRMNPDWYYAA